MGILLRRERDRLEDARVHRRALAGRQAETNDIQDKLYDLEKERRELREFDSDVEDVLAQLPPEMAEQRRQDIERVVRELLAGRRELVDSLISDYEKLFNELLAANDREIELINQIERFDAFINERILWVRSARVMGPSDIMATLESVEYFTEPDQWRELVNELWNSKQRNPTVPALAFLVFIVLLSMQTWLRRRLRALGETAGRSLTLTFLPTLRALLVTFLIATVWPLGLAALGWWLSSSIYASEFSKAIGNGLLAAAGVALTIEFLRQVARPYGLAVKHFSWSGRAMQQLRRHLFWLGGVSLPLVAVFVATESTDDYDIRNTLGRLAFCVVQILIAVFAAIVFKPGSGVLREFAIHHQWWSPRKLRFLLYPLLILLPISLAALAVTGFYFSALRLSVMLGLSLWLGIVLLLAHALSVRWLLLSRRRLSISQAKRRAAAGARA